MRFPFLEFVIAVRIAAALMFFTAAIGKARRWSAFEGVVANYRLLPDPLVRVVARLLPPGEILPALALAFGLPGSELAASALLCLFAAAMAINLARGRTHIDCGLVDKFSERFTGRLAGYFSRRGVEAWIAKARQ